MAPIIRLGHGLDAQKTIHDLEMKLSDYKIRLKRGGDQE
jgi:hypothetical protein